MIWDPILYATHASGQFKMGREVYLQLDPRPGERILDVGCGEGRLTERLAAAVGPEGMVAGIDPSAEMISMARSRAGHRARYAMCALEELEAREAFEGVFSNATLHWVADLENGLGRIHAALVPGGRMSAACLGEGAVCRVGEVMDALIKEPPFREYFGPGWCYPLYLRKPAAVHAMLAAVGFNEREVTMVQQETDYHGREALASGMAAALARPYLSMLPQALGQQFLQQLGERVIPVAGASCRVASPHLRLFARKGT